MRVILITLTTVLRTPSTATTTAVPYAATSLIVWAISLQSKRIARIAFAPICWAIWHIRITATCRDSASIWVYSGTSPPPSDRKLAVKFEPKSRLRTVRPKTSPNTLSAVVAGQVVHRRHQHRVRRPGGATCGTFDCCR